RFLAEELGVSRDAVQILTGHSGRRKTISINI
ncbi:MAG TPA: YggU family protein, partial [Candidatus Jacksonbacteria bacterium]|nr:YggU family protein [Candidatus Jacksonbacteria bacterium]